MSSTSHTSADRKKHVFENWLMGPANGRKLMNQVMIEFTTLHFGLLAAPHSRNAEDQATPWMRDGPAHGSLRGTHYLFP
jgi:hypothetical protein